MATASPMFYLSVGRDPPASCCSLNGRHGWRLVADAVETVGRSRPPFVTRLAKLVEAVDASLAIMSWCQLNSAVLTAPIFGRISRYRHSATQDNRLACKPFHPVL